jgi:hypothetical protein
MFIPELLRILAEMHHRAIEEMKRLVEKYRVGFEKYLDNEVGNGSGLN